MSSYPTLKLTYFAISTGRAEVVRLALAIGGIPFEDDRVTFPQWPALKPTLPFQQMPVLTVNGDTIAQNVAIARYVGTLAGLYPSANPLEAARVDEIFLAVEDIRSVLLGLLGIQDEAARKAEGEKISATTLTQALRLLDARLTAKSKGTPYLLDKLSMADLDVYTIVSVTKSGWLAGISTTVADAFPKVSAVYNAVAAHPKVAEWVAKHT
ncbi:Aste57867_7314 [Aphanomyces stellatus]|uniref:Aste57867_6377 protein n=1 Tax=Aphanomyces stellatus TaxID=120398 RepID=A0A485KI59_9STRA|nr:hypothetical protein As57867_007288 [Aphanomyces stellatus]KAF0708344.1 hypothetical protein As57867_006362 [Aphanomyces stellatus]VFT83372.1 Aste57867_6377 [Aphanomyces stellatus]VFT84233.1 Aste57867_7314 [Aphanomyces stellatus]